MLRGLAHPLRVRLLNLLRERGPSTASRLAELVGQSSGATSYHLRQLETYGFVAEETGRGTARERWWRATSARTVLDADTSRSAGAAAEGYLRAVAAADFQRVEAMITELPAMPAEWQDAVWLNTDRLVLSPRRAVELRERMAALIQEFAPEDEPADQVTVQFQVVPQPGRTSGER